MKTTNNYQKSELVNNQEISFSIIDDSYVDSYRRSVHFILRKG